jgi:hypothetical protein
MWNAVSNVWIRAQHALFRAARAMEPIEPLENIELGG